MTETVFSHRPNPCKGCPDRYPACCDRCRKPEYLNWKAEQKKIRDNRKNYTSSIWSSQEPYDRRRK